MRRKSGERIRVAHIMGEFMRGGTERIVLDLLSRLDPEEFDVHVLCTTSEGLDEVRRRYEESGITTRGVTNGLGLMSGRGWGLRMGPRKIVSLLRLARTIKKGAFTIVHTHGLTNNLYGRAAAVLAGTRVIVTHEHNANRYTGRDKLLWRLLNLRTALNISVSSTIADLRGKSVPSSRKKSLTLLNGINVETFRPPTDVERAEAKRAFGMDPRTKVIGTMSRLVPEKCVDLFLRAAAMTIDGGADAHFLVAGDGEMRRGLEDLSAELGVSDSVTFSGWIAEPERALWAMDAFVTLSDDYEGFGLAPAEAMACGLPSVCIDSPLNREILSSECAILVGPEAEEVAEAMTLLLSDDEVVGAMRSAASRRAASRYDIGRAACELQAIYEDLLAGRRPPSRGRVDLSTVATS